VGTYGIHMADFRHESGLEDLRPLARYAPVKIDLLGFACLPEHLDIRRAVFDIAKEEGGQARNGLPHGAVKNVTGRYKYPVDLLQDARRRVPQQRHARACQIIRDTISRPHREGRSFADAAIVPPFAISKPDDRAGEY
jgi:hypothetical protein